MFLNSELHLYLHTVISEHFGKSPTQLIFSSDQRSSQMINVIELQNKA